MSDKTKTGPKKIAKVDKNNNVKDSKNSKDNSDDIFCEKCGNILDISRSLLTDNNEDAEPIVNAVIDQNDIDYEKILKKIEKNEKITESELLSINVKEMVKNDYYKKMTKKGEIKKQIQDMVEDMGNSDENTQAYMVCKNCLFTKPIKDHLRILTKNPEGVTATHDYINESNFRIRAHVRTMPCTRNFHCLNEDCPVYTKNLPQEATFFRKGADTYETIYVCRHCRTIKMN